eukprot:5694108-Prorocentrum_lima.AAC.1
MTSSLVGSEMCIRDRVGNIQLLIVSVQVRVEMKGSVAVVALQHFHPNILCLLYTSDAADDM